MVDTSFCVAPEKRARYAVAPLVPQQCQGMPTGNLNIYSCLLRLLTHKCTCGAVLIIGLLLYLGVYRAESHTLPLLLVFPFSLFFCDLFPLFVRSSSSFHFISLNDPSCHPSCHTFCYPDSQSVTCAWGRSLGCWLWGRAQRGTKASKTLPRCVTGIVWHRISWTPTTRRQERAKDRERGEEGGKSRVGE